MPRMKFSGRTYFEFHQTENAMRCERINDLLDAGTRVFGDPNKDAESPKPDWVEIDEAVQPRSHGLDVRTKDGKVVRIFAYDASDAAVAACRPLEKKDVGEAVQG
jgi:hypothetical protein